MVVERKPGVKVDLKEALTNDPVLGLFDEICLVELYTSASGYGIGAIFV